MLDTVQVFDLDSLFLATPREGYYPNRLCRSTERLSSRPSPSADEGAGIQTPGRLTPGLVRSPSILLLGGDMCPTASPSAHGPRPLRTRPAPRPRTAGAHSRSSGDLLSASCQAAQLAHSRPSSWEGLAGGLGSPGSRGSRQGAVLRVSSHCLAQGNWHALW